MTITIDLTPEQEAQLAEAAAVQGKDLSDFAQELTRERLMREAERGERIRLLYAMGSPGVVLSDEATRRESLYED